MKSHKDLEVWRASIDMARDIYELTRAYPKEEQYGIVSQMRRSAVSVASNIAEGAARQGNMRLGNRRQYTLPNEGKRTYRAS